MNNIRGNIVSLIILSVGVLTLSILFSGAPLRVHIVDAFCFVLAFTIPAAYINDREDIKKNRFQIIVFWLIGTLAWYFLSALVIVKAELTISRLAILLLTSIIGLFLFIAIHLALLKLRHGNKPE